MRKLFVFLLLSWIFMSCEKDVSLKRYSIVAHQGYWKAANGTSNSIKGLTETARLGIDGVELDVRITNDNVLILHHDAIAGNYSISESQLSDIKRIRLSDGSTIPTLEEYLNVALNIPNLKLYIDIKTIESLKPVIDMVMKYQLGHRIILLTPIEMGISALEYNLDLKVHCLSSNKTPLELKEYGFSGISYNIDILKKHIDWIDQAHSVGLIVGCWVVKSESEIIWCSHNNVDYVTTDFPLECKHYLFQ